jgi:hypothetical protein
MDSVSSQPTSKRSRESLDSSGSDREVLMEQLKFLTNQFSIVFNSRDSCEGNCNPEASPRSLQRGSQQAFGDNRGWQGLRNSPQTRKEQASFAIDVFGVTGTRSLQLLYRIRNAIVRTSGQPMRKATAICHRRICC